MRETGSQTGFTDLPDDPSWEEVEGLLQQAKDFGNLAIEVREKAFAALDRLHTLHPEANPAVTSWRKRVAMKREAVAHMDDWLVQRRQRLQREREEADRQARARAEVEYAEARRHRLEEEQSIQSARARWEEARRAEERAAIGLGLAQERGNAPNPPGTSNLRRYPVCA